MNKKQIHILISTHQGKLYDELCDYIVVKSLEGEFAILPDHMAIINSFKAGYIKLVAGKDILFISLTNMVMEFHDNTATVLAQEAHVGRDMESADRHLSAARNERLEKNRKLDADLTLSEKEMIDNIKKAKAGNL